MWEAAIRAVKNTDDTWISNNRKDFISFFKKSNERPQGELSDKSLQFHYEAGLFKMFLSKSYNGLELPLQTGSRWIEQASVLDGNWGWLLAIGVGGAYFVDYMSPEIAETYFLPKKALVAGSGKPDGRAVKSGEDKWEVNGSWRYCSGSEQASFFTAVTKKENAVTALVLPKEEVEIERDWDAIGLPLTCSHKITVRGALINEDHFFDLSGNPRDSEYPLSSYPFMLFAQVCFVPVIIGLSRALWMEVDSYMKDKKSLWQEFQPQRYNFIVDKSENYHKEIEMRKSVFYKTVELSWQNHVAGKDPLEQKLSQNAVDLTGFCFISCATILPKLGMAVLEKGHPVQVIWKNLQTAYQHMVFHQYE